MWWSVVDVVECGGCDGFKDISLLFVKTKLLGQAK